MSPFCQRFDVAAGGAADADHRLDRVRRGELRQSWSSTPQALQRDSLGEAFAQRTAHLVAV